MAKREATSETGPEGAAPHPNPADRTDARRRERLALILALEVRRIIEDLLFRKGLLLEVWSKMRARAPLLRILRSRYDGITAADLLLLPEALLPPLDRFYRQLDELRLYFETTEDMPRSLEGQYDLYARQLEDLGVVLLEGLRPLHGQDIGGAGKGVVGGEILEEVGVPPMEFSEGEPFALHAGDWIDADLEDDAEAREDEGAHDADEGDADADEGDADDDEGDAGGEVPGDAPRT